jgi:photosystem II stability/assembly factor-like uncharacterized protein
MKFNYLTVFPLIVLICSILSCEESGRSFEEMEEGLYPNEWLISQRMYPHSEIDYKSVKEARAIAQQLYLENENSRTENVEWELIGPHNIGGRITDIAISPENDDHFFIGTAVGGVFRTLDRGKSWVNVTDDFEIEPSVGNLAIAPSNASRIYLGTGEANGSATSGAFFGNGVFRSTDNGDTWESIGLTNSGHIGRIVVDPTDENRVFVAATGTLYSKNNERGIYRTTDGGANWEQVLFVSDSTALIDVAINPENPDILFAASWERIRYPWIRDYGGETSGVYRSLDGGDTWVKLNNNGLPVSNEDTGRIGLAISESNPNSIYASYTDNKVTNVFDGLYKSEDNGENWTEVTLGQIDNVNSSFGWYFGNIRVNPEDENDVFVMGQRLYRGNFPLQSYEQITEMHVDHHALEFSKLNPDFIVEGNDGGLYLSEDGGGTWEHLTNLPITQFYNIEVDETDENIVLGGTQDNNTILTKTGSNLDWYPILGGDGFHVNVDPDENNIIYAEYQFGNLFKSVDGGDNMTYALDGVSGADRNNWNTPVVLSPFDNNIVYYGSNRLYVSEYAENWSHISGDLTNGLHPTGSSAYGTLTAIAPSYNNLETVYTGSDDGRVYVTFNGGLDWNSIDESLPNRYVSQVAIHPEDDLTAFVLFSGFAYLDYASHIFVTHDGGESWTDISWNLPDIPLNDIVYHPELDAWIVSADMGIWINFDYMEKDWEPLGSSLPPTIIADLKYHQPSDNLYAGTFGRSIFKLDMSEIEADTTTVSTNDLKSLEIEIFPNPVSDYLMIDLAASNEGPLNWTIMTKDGKYIQSGLLEGEGSNRINTSELSAGGYILQLRTEETLTTKKFIIQ